MKIFHLEFAKTGMWMSGGEKCMVENIKYFSSKNIKNILLTTDNGKAVYEKLGLTESDNLHYIVMDSFWTESKYHVFISYVIRIFKFKKIIKNIFKQIDKKNDVLICHSDFFPNTIPAKILSSFFDKKIIFWLHALAPNIFKGYSGQYTGKYSIPKLNIIHNKLNQLYFFFISKKHIIVTVNNFYKSILNKKNIYVIKKFGGIEVQNNSNMVSFEEKEYDIVFMGRFQEPKGLLEIPEILLSLKKIKNNVKLVIMGDGDQSLKSELFSRINDLGLIENVVYLGFVDNQLLKEKYLSKSKVFIFPSYCESFGLVVIEAMAHGLPVVSYDLPVYDVFGDKIIKVPILNNDKFSDEVLNLISNKNEYLSKSAEVKSFAETFSWEKTGNELMDLMVKYD